MVKKLLFFLFLAGAACSRLPIREEVDFRNQLEDAIVKTFPNKVVVYLHDFSNQTPRDKDNAYLNQAVPDAVEAAMEAIRDNLSYRPFEEVPFYVSTDISNILQRLTSDKTNTNASGASLTNNFFSYITNYLILTQEMITQVEYDITTNTNYYEEFTNTFFDSGTSVTNYTSNQILVTTTNSSNDVVTAEDRYILTPTNMLLLIHEEFPYLTNYLSSLPIEIVRASKSDEERLRDHLDPLGAAARRRRKEQEVAVPKEEKDIADLIQDLRQRIGRGERGARAEMQRQQAILSNMRQERLEKAALEAPETNQTPASTAPANPEPFIYEYHVYGRFTTLRQTRVEPLTVSLELLLSPVYSTGHMWWTNTFNSAPPQLSELLTLVNSLDTNDSRAFLDLGLRTPYKKPPITPRLQDEIDSISTNNYLDGPEPASESLATRDRPLYLRRTVTEDKISALIHEWQKFLTADIINRPYTVLTATSTPDRSLVYMDGIYIGRTPFTYPVAPLGKHRFTFLQEGYERAEIFAEITGGQTNHIDYQLTSLNNTGTIKITSSLPSSEVYLNAAFLGIAPVTVSNLSLGQRYRIEVLNPDFALQTNRNSAYKQITLTERNPNAVFDATFKMYETSYRPRTQKLLLAATYLSWLSTVALMGGTIYSYALFQENQALADTVTGDLRQQYLTRANNFSVTSQVLLYTSLGGIFVSSGIMGWYLYSKDVYLGFSSPTPNYWLANLKIRF